MPIGSWDTVPISFVRSDKDEHFTGSLAQDAMEVETLGVPGVRETSEYVIESITVQSDQNLEWDVFLWASILGAGNADLDLDEFIEYINFPTAIGRQIGGAGQYYYAATGLTIPYRDLDGEGGIHVGLVNRSVTAKNAGATGEAVIRLGVRPIGFA